MGLRARFAGHTFELIGCDTLHNADKFARFPGRDDPVDCRIEVSVQDSRLELPQGHIAQTGDWRTFAYGDRKRFYHRHRTMMVEADDAFSRVHLTLSTAMPQMEIVQYLQVQQMICSYLLLHGGGLIHSAGLVMPDRNGVLLCGRTGVGKSTMARLLYQADPRSCILSEDMPAVKCGAERMDVYGTPLCGDDMHCSDRSAPLSKVVLLRQGAHNRLTVPSAGEAVYELLSVVPRLVYAQQVATAATDLVMTITQKLPLVIFENNGTPEAAQMLLSYLQTDPEGFS